jgi:glycosyltransferase involved in cell wall biosynthesis
MADVLSEVAQDAALRDTLSAAGRTRARGFSWQDAATRTLDLYRSLV